MQYSIPQFIEVEDRVLGPLTVKQFLYLLAGGIVEIIFWSLADLSLFIFLTLINLAIVIPIAFVKVNGRPFIKYLSSMIQFFSKPKLYFWSKVPELKKVEVNEFKRRGEKVVEAEIGPKKIPRSKLAELSIILDSRAIPHPEEFGKELGLKEEAEEEKKFRK